MTSSPVASARQIALSVALDICYDLACGARDAIIVSIPADAPEVQGVALDVPNSVARRQKEFAALIVQRLSRYFVDKNIYYPHPWVPSKNGPSNVVDGRQSEDAWVATRHAAKLRMRFDRNPMPQCLRTLEEFDSFIRSISINVGVRQDIGYADTSFSDTKIREQGALVLKFYAQFDPSR